MVACVICLKPIRLPGETQHKTCVETLYGTDRAPRVPFSADTVVALVCDMIGKMSISGLQEKLSLSFSTDRTCLEPVAVGGQFILKPQSVHLRAMPENEHLTMRLAGQCGIEISPLGLVQLSDGGLAFIIRRFDHLADGSRLAMEDFCQLAELSSRDKYEGTAELCVRILRKFVTEPKDEIAKLFRQLLFAWWTGNGDLHLKNLSILNRSDGARVLSPAYDLLCTRLIIPDDEMALPMQGKRKEIRRKNWMVFGDYCKLSKHAVDELVGQQIEQLKPALDLVQASFLPDNQKLEYTKILKSNTAILSKK
jgi:serine/threonine-protein kinase HipA